MKDEVIARILRHAQRVEAAAPAKKDAKKAAPKPSMSVQAAKIQSVVHRAFTASGVKIGGRSNIAITKREDGAFNVVIAAPLLRAVGYRAITGARARLTHSFTLAGQMRMQAIVVNGKPALRFVFTIRLVKDRAKV